MISFSSVSKAFSSQLVLNEVSFTINPNERVGIVGPNGAGKSTLFNLITREITPDRGSISLPNNLRIACLHQHSLHNINSKVTLLEYTTDAKPEIREIKQQIHLLESNPQNLQNQDIITQLGNWQSRLEHLGFYNLETQAKIALSGLGFKIDHFNRPLNEFSGGWQMRATLAQILISDPDLLLLDEPSNYLDIPAIEWLDSFLKNFKGTLLLISHDRFLLRTLVNSIIELNGGHITRYNGNYDYYAKERLLRAEIASSQRKNLNKSLDDMTDFINRFRSKSTKAAAVQSMIKKREKIIQNRSEISAPEGLHYAAKLVLPSPPDCGSNILSIENLSFFYKPNQWIIKNFSIDINKGDKIAIVGYNGMGKTTLLKLIAGALTPVEGSIQIGYKVIIGYQSQDFADVLPLENTVLQIAQNALPDHAESRNLRNFLGSFGFSNEAVDKTAKVLSGGEKIRLCFARIFLNPPNLLILDEPTTHLDIQACETLQQSIQQYSGTILMVSHDIDFIRQTANHIIAITPNGIQRYFGNYQYYLEKSQNELSPNQINSTDKNLKINTISNKEQRRLKAEKRNEMTKLKRVLEQKISEKETMIESLENQKDSLLQQISETNSNINFAELNKSLTYIQKQIDAFTLEWEKLTDEHEIFLNQYKEI